MVHLAFSGRPVVWCSCKKSVNKPTMAASCSNTNLFLITFIVGTPLVFPSYSFIPCLPIYESNSVSSELRELASGRCSRWFADGDLIVASNLKQNSEDLCHPRCVICSAATCRVSACRTAGDGEVGLCDGTEFKVCFNQSTKHLEQT